MCVHTRKHGIDGDSHHMGLSRVDNNEYTATAFKKLKIVCLPVRSVRKEKEKRLG